MSISTLSTTIILLLNAFHLAQPNCLPSCLSCANNGQCTQCTNNHYLTISSQPIQGCLPCRPSCKTCTNESSTCNQCALGYYGSADGCERCGQHCDECDHNNPSTCVSCQTGYYLISATGLCQACTTYENAQTCRQNIILTCVAGYYAEGGQKCVSCTQHCLTCTSATFCTQCQVGYYGSSCLPCDSSCESCINANSCITCPSTYYWSNQLCSPCQKSFCSECLSSGQCLFCVADYYLAGTNECLAVDTSQLIKGCLRYVYTQQFECLECDVGHYLQSGICLPCSLLCDRCSDHFGTSECTQCSEFGRLVTNGICILRNTVGVRELLYVSEWNHPSSYSHIGNAQYTTCLSPKLSSSVEVQLGAIQGYDIVLHYKLTMKLVPGLNIIQFIFNAESVGNITLNTSQLIECSEGVYIHEGELSLSSTQSTNKLTLSVEGGYLSMSQGIVAYKPCHHSCLLCSSYYACRVCVDDSLRVEEYQCVSRCSDLFYLEGNTCTKQCKDGSYPSTTQSEWECIGCRDECLSCSSVDVCSMCSVGYYLFDGQCLSLCPQQYFGNSITNRCQSCQPPCYTCTQAQCLSCSFNFLQGGLCVGPNECNNGTYPSFKNMQCQLCVSPCVQCTTLNICTQCQNELYLYEGECIHSCPSRYVSVNGKCERCQPPCYECEGNVINCSRCENGFLHEGECLVDCPSTTYQWFEGMSCRGCASPCLDCFAERCVSCVEGYILHESQQSCLSVIECRQLVGSYADDGLCRLCPTQCTDCSSFTVCTECQEGYYFQQSQCLPSCPLNKYASSSTNTCSNCSENCLTCSHDSTFCTSCPSTFIINYENYCVKDCGAGRLAVTCEECAYPCSECVHTVTYCTSCVDGFYYLEGQCLLECYAGYYPNSNYQCQLCVEPCRICKSATQCTSCGTDSQGNQFHLRIYDYDSRTGECVSQCPQLSYSHQNVCQSCQSPCKQCSSQTECLSCEGSYLLEGSECVVGCSFGMYNMSGSCQGCVGPCLTCRGVGVCESCEQGYYLHGVGCERECPSGTIPIPTTNTCQECEYPCAECSGNTENCTKCAQPSSCEGCVVYYYWKHECLTSCPSITYKHNDECVQCVSPCYTCTSAEICTSCVDGYFILNGQCSTQCAEGYYADASTRQCQKCEYPCLSCSSISLCIECMDGVFYNGVCLLSSSCPSRYYQVFANGHPHCEECPSDCGECVQGLCISCIDAVKSLLDGHCIELCPVGYYSQQFVCRRCLQQCESCEGEQLCTGCKHGYYLLNDSCVDVCPPSHYYQDARCMACTFPCRECVHHSDNCISCEQGYLLYQFGCIAQCPPKTYVDRVVSKCRECQYPCEYCSSSQTCTRCLSGFYLNSNGLCLSSCPTAIDSEGVRCVDACPSHQYMISHESSNRCSVSCEYPYIVHGNDCIINCTDNNLYIDEHLQCVSSEGVDPGILTVGRMQVRQEPSRQISLLLTFNHEVEYELITTLASIVEIKLYLSPQYSTNRRLYTQQVAFIIAEQTSHYILIQLELDTNVHGQLVQLDLLQNANLLIRSRVSTIPLQSSSFEATLPLYEAYPILYRAENFRIFGEVIVDFMLIVGFFLFLWNWYAKIYQFLHHSQFMFLLATLSVAYPPNLSYFLQGFRWSHFYQIENWFLQPNNYTELTSAPDRIASLFGDVNFIRVWGHCFCLILILVGVLLLAWLGTLGSYSSNQTLKKMATVLRNKMGVVKWSHIHDLVMSMCMISVFGFFVQMYDYEPDSTLQILAIAISYLIAALIVGYYIFMGCKLHALVRLSETDPQRFCHKGYLFRDDLMSITESAVHPKELYLNYLRAIRIVVIGGIVGLFNDSPNLCVGSFIIMLLVSALIYLIVKPYPENLQNMLLGLADVFVIGALIFITVIDYYTVDGPSIENLELKWGLGWATIILIIVATFLLMVEVVISIIRGNSCPQELPAEDLEKEQEKTAIPRKIMVYDKKQFEGWSCEEGSALTYKNIGFEDHVREVP